MSDGNLKEEDLDGHEALSECHQETLIQILLILEEVNEEGFRDVLLHDDDEDHNSEHVCIRKWIISFDNA